MRRSVARIKQVVTRLESSSLPRLKEAEIYGAIILGGILLLLIAVRLITRE